MTSSTEKSTFLQKQIANIVAQSPITTRTNIQNTSVKKYDRARSVLRKLQRAERDQMNPRIPLLIREIETWLEEAMNYNYITIKSDLWKKISTRDNLTRTLNQDIYEESSEGSKNLIYLSAADRYLETRSEEWTFRILEELADHCFPVFWTLTAAPEFENVFDRGSQVFKNWRRTVKKKFGEFNYCAVTERGTEGRLHLHTLFTFRECRFSDPNTWGSGSNQLIEEMRSLWPYGHGDPIAIRYSPTDIYGHLNWRWPTGQQTGSPQAIAIYMAKYLRIATQETNRCRTKTSQNFGMKRLNQITLAQALSLRTMTTEKARTYLKLKSTPPKRLVNYAVNKKIFADQIPDTLPEATSGSVRLASLTLTKEIYNRQNAGDIIQNGPGFSELLNQWKNETQSLRMGLITT